jgi:hypothetical protein
LFRVARRARSFAAHVVLLCTPLIVRADDWPVFQHDLQHTGRSTASFDPRDLTVQWEPQGPTATGMPLIIGDHLIARGNSQITSYDLNTGSVNWDTTLPSQSQGHPGVGFGMYVALGSDGGFSANSLYVMNAATGQMKYTGPSIFTGFANITVAQPAGASNPIAFVQESAGRLRAMSLGPTSAAVLWTALGDYGGSGDPTIVGNSVVVAGPGQYYAYDLLTGAANHFHTSNLSGGGGTTVVHDAARGQFYVCTEYAYTGTQNTEGDTLTAYSYTNNSTITELWRKHGPELAAARSVALGPTGKIYTQGGGLLTERDPVTGDVLRSVSGDFSIDQTPIVQDGYVWAVTDFAGERRTNAYDLDTFELVRSLEGAPASSVNVFNMVGALDDTHFVRLGSAGPGGPGMSVYVIPEPTGLAMAGLALAALAARRRRNRKGDVR